MAYTVALPAAYDDTQQYALMVYLHGAGMSGEAIPPDTPLIVLMPQMPSYSRWSFYADDVLGLVDEVTANYPIDERRIYMTGYSDGGYGALAIGAAGAERFAAVLSGGGYWLGDAQPLCTLAEQQVPISLHHAELDTIIPFEKALDVEKHLTGCGADVRLIAYQGETHISVVSMIFQGSGIYEWLLSQQRAG
jgi:predicted peptidase